MNSVVETKVNLGEDDIKRILVAEVAKVIILTPAMIKDFVRNALFYRTPKNHSYDKENDTFFESVLKKTFQPIIVEEMTRVAEANRSKLSKIIKEAFHEKVIVNKEFETRLIEQLSRFTSNIEFYVSSE